MIKTTHHPNLMTGSLETAGLAHVIACLKALVLEQSMRRGHLVLFMLQFQLIAAIVFDLHSLIKKWVSKSRRALFHQGPVWRRAVVSLRRST